MPSVDVVRHVRRRDSGPTTLIDQDGRRVAEIVADPTRRAAATARAGVVTLVARERHADAGGGLAVRHLLHRLGDGSCRGRELVEVGAIDDTKRTGDVRLARLSPEAGAGGGVGELHLILFAGAGGDRTILADAWRGRVTVTRVTLAVGRAGAAIRGLAGAGDALVAAGLHLADRLRRVLAVGVRLAFIDDTGRLADARAQIAGLGPLAVEIAPAARGRRNDGLTCLLTIAAERGHLGRVLLAIEARRAGGGHDARVAFHRRRAAGDDQGQDGNGEGREDLRERHGRPPKPWESRYGTFNSSIL